MKDNDLGRSPDGAGLSSTTEPVPVSALRASIPSACDRDAILMEVAGWVEEMDLLAISGIMHRRKRVREDAALRIKTSDEVRARMADMIRGRMENKVGDPLDFLSGLKAGRYARCYTGFDLREAIALADKGLLSVSVVTQIAGPWNNTVGGNTEYSIKLTDEGEQFLASGIEARSDETAQQAQPEGQEPGPKGDALPSPPTGDDNV